VRRILYFTADENYLYDASGSTLRLEAQFQTSEAGVAEFRDYLRGRRGTLLSVLADVPGEEFHEEQLFGPAEGLHSTFRMVNWDGRGEQLACEMSERCGYPVESDMGYPCPGSFGTKYGVELNLEVVTLESPYLLAEEAGWLECRTALRWCVDLPD